MTQGPPFDPAVWQATDRYHVAFDGWSSEPLPLEDATALAERVRNESVTIDGPDGPVEVGPDPQAAIQRLWVFTALGPQEWRDVEEAQ